MVEAIRVAAALAAKRKHHGDTENTEQRNEENRR